MSDKRYSINSPTVVYDIIDHEVVVIDFNTGSYYSLEGASAALWGMVSAGCSVAHIIEHFEASNGDGSSGLKSDVTSFLGQLEVENLIVEESGTVSGALAVPPPLPIDTGTFTGFAFQKFRDMNQLLLLDPIHEVAAAGWPQVPADAAMKDGPQR